MRGPQKRLSSCSTALQSDASAASPAEARRKEEKQRASKHSTSQPPGFASSCSAGSQLHGPTTPAVTVRGLPTGSGERARVELVYIHLPIPNSPLLAHVSALFAHKIRPAGHFSTWTTVTADSYPCTTVVPNKRLTGQVYVTAPDFSVQRDWRASKIYF